MEKLELKQLFKEAAYEVLIESGLLKTTDVREENQSTGFSAPDSEGFVRCHDVDTFFENAQASGDTVILEAMQDPDLPSKFLVADFATRMEQIVQIAHNSAFVRVKFGMLGASDKLDHLFLDYMRFGKQRPGEFLPKTREATTGMYVGYEHYEYEDNPWFIPTADGGWHFHPNRKPYRTQHFVRFARDWLKEKARILRGDASTFVDFSPSERFTGY